MHDLQGNALVSRLLTPLQILSQVELLAYIEDCFHLCQDGIELLMRLLVIFFRSHLVDLIPFPQSLGILLGSSSNGSYEREDNWISVAETPWYNALRFEPMEMKLVL